jgi:hypothetical protein
MEQYLYVTKMREEGGKWLLDSPAAPRSVVNSEQRGCQVRV